jgi:hypothetical protein
VPEIKHYKAKVKRILIKYAKDSYCLHSIERYLTGHTKIMFHKFEHGYRSEKIRTIKITDKFMFKEWGKLKGGISCQGKYHTEVLNAR